MISKPGYSASLFSMPSLDFWQVESNSKAVKCWNGSSCDPKENFEVDLKLCIFCQKRNEPKDDVREATCYSKNFVYEATTKQRKYGDVANRAVIDRLVDLLGTNDDTCIVLRLETI